MPAPDTVSPELRAVEREVDSAYLRSHLVSLTFGEAAWCFLAFCEDRLTLPLMKLDGDKDERSIHERVALADEVVNHAKWPMRWLARSCSRGSVVPMRYQDETYTSAVEFSTLASSYVTFESAFTYASLGLVSLRLEKNRIVPSDDLKSDTRFEAYDRLADLDDQQDRFDPSYIAEMVLPSLRVRQDRFSYGTSPRIIEATLAGAESLLARLFRSPVEWELSGYSMSEFAAVAKCVWSISAIHHVARLLAAARGCKGLGYRDGVFVTGRSDLTRRLTRYTGLPETRVKAVLGDMLFGTGKIHQPDLAFQPLVPVTEDRLAWAPTLFLTNSLERNLLVLLNRSPDIRQAYARLSQQKEDILRSRLVSQLSELGFRFWNGTVRGWQKPLDIDFAIVSESEKLCLLLELKSFIAPAEPREIKDRSEEIATGIAQVKRRRECSRSQPEPLYKVLGIDPTYDIAWALASETSVGAGWVQDESVPVVRAQHMVKQLRSSRSLRQVCDWLIGRAYLPIEGTHYDMVPVVVQINEWELEWHGIRGLGW